MRMRMVLAAGVALALAGEVAAQPSRFFWSNGWTSDATAQGTVNRINADGSGATVLGTGFFTIYDVEIDRTAGNLYWNNWIRPASGGAPGLSEAIYRADLNGAGQVLFTGANTSANTFASGLHGISLDTAGQVVYFTRGVSYADFGGGFGPEVSRINYDGTGYTKLNPADDGWFLSGVDVDTTTSLLYWGSPGIIIQGLTGAVNVMTTAGGSPTTMVPHTDGLGRSIAVDPAAGTIFFTAWNILDPTLGGQIWRIQTDGTGLTMLPIPGLSGVPDIELDTAAGRIYWTDFVAGTIRSSDYLGGDVQVHISGLFEPFGLALEFAAVPEPTTYVMIAGVVGAAGYFTWRRKRLQFKEATTR